MKIDDMKTTVDTDEATTWHTWSMTLDGMPLEIQVGWTDGEDRFALLLRGKALEQIPHDLIVDMPAYPDDASLGTFKVLRGGVPQLLAGGP